MSTVTAEQLAHDIRMYVRAAENGTLVKPGHRVPFHWPRHPISADFHVLGSDWTGEAQFTAHGETFQVEVARTPHGFFGRCPVLRGEARGENIERMLENLRAACEPLFARQFAKAKSLGTSGRFTGNVRSLDPLSLLKLLYCDDRDVANTARIEIETHASTQQFGPALLEILRDQHHPNRRIAQWCVLDLLEDISGFFPDVNGQQDAVVAIGDLIFEATDDYARAIFKAGVVLGGHICNEPAFDQLKRCLRSPNKIARRSSIHGLFHLAEWRADLVEPILSELESAASTEQQPNLAIFARSMVTDIRAGDLDHMTEPTFDDEL